jgi:ribosomal protein L37AE/L43A
MTDEFEQFWQVYPRKCAKGDARKAWKQTAGIRPPIGELVKKVYAARASKQWLKDEGEYIPYPASYLRGERWEDEMEVDLSQMRGPTGKVCAYCGKNSVGSVGGIWHCAEHSRDAMDGKKTKVVSIGSKADPEVVDKKLQSCGS